MIFIFLLSINLFPNDFLNLHHNLSKVVSSYSIDVDEIKTLIDSGIDLNKKNAFGATALHNAIESWAYVSYLPEVSSKMTEIILYILNSRSDIDVSTPDNRGISPLYAVFRWGNWGAADFTVILDEVLKRNPDMNTKSYEGFGLQLFLVSGFLDDRLEDFVERGMEFTEKTITGDNYLHYAIRNSNPTVGGVQSVEYIANLLPSKLLKKYKNGQGNFGFTPLHFGARNGNLEGVKYLIETLKVKHSIQNSEGKTPLDIAYDRERKEVIEYLESIGANRRELNEKTSCRKRNQLLEVNYENVQALIEKCNIKKVKNLLKILPASYLGHHTFSYATLAAMDANEAFPMVTTYGEDGKFMMSFNGHRSQDGFEKLDIIQFRDENKKFEMRQIKFPEKSHGDVSYSKANPVSCLACHGSKPRPLWDTWTFWPGKFRGEAGSIHPKESKLYDVFLKNRNKGRYKYIPGLSPERITHFIQKEYMGKSPNVSLDILSEGLVSEMIGREIKDTETLFTNRYSILAALSCNDDINNYINPTLVSQFKYNEEHYKRITTEAIKGEFINRYNLLEEFLGGPVENRYVYNQMNVNNLGFGKNSIGRNFSLSQTIKIRYLIEELGHNINHWFTPFNMGQGNSYVRFDWATIEWVVWKEVLSKDQDAELYTLYENVEKNTKVWTIEAVPYLFYDKGSDEQKRVCEILKEKTNSN